MDIAQIQRANQMAKDLLDKGIASSMEEGMQIAENILSKSEGVVPQASGPAGATPLTVSVSTGTISGSASLPAAPETATADALNTELRTLNFRLNEQANHIKHLQQQIMELNSKLAAAHTARPMPRVISEPAPSGQTQLMHEELKTVTIINATTGETVRVAEGESNTDSVGKRLHARVGAYTSGDVAVEKMFYCGGK